MYCICLLKFNRKESIPNIIDFVIKNNTLHVKMIK